MMNGKNLVIEQIGPALIISDAIDYIIKELECSNINRSVLIELNVSKTCPFIVTHPTDDFSIIEASYNGIDKYISKANKDFETI